MKARNDEPQAFTHQIQDKLSEEDRRLTELIRNELQSIEIAYEEKLQPPNVHQLQRMVAEQKSAVRRKFRNELLLFWSIALVILASCIAIIQHNLELFALLQLGSTLIAIAVLAGSVKNRRGRG